MVMLWPTSAGPGLGFSCVLPCFSAAEHSAGSEPHVHAHKASVRAWSVAVGPCDPCLTLQADAYVIPSAAQVRGVVLLNGAGRFDDVDEQTGAIESTDEVSVTPTGELAQKVTMHQ